ncbi:MAG: hypothetical protein K0U40_05515 [Betaproteobacteria bacterium]|nr:hypothetical protein [Betaproteobacteria bacterium]
MTIARKPKKPNEVEIATLIEKGGSVPKSHKRAGKTDLKNVQLRLSENIISDIDNIRQQNIVAPSRHAWILTAIKEKIGRDVKTTS